MMTIAEAACSGWDLSSGRAVWGSFRDSWVKRFERSSNGRVFWMRQTVEPNVWQILSSEKPRRADSDERVEGFTGSDRKGGRW